MAYGRIYGLEYLVDHRIYVGQTTRDIRERLKEHKSAKKTPVGKAINEYGLENFIWVELEECDSREELDEAERRWIEKLNCIYPNGFNRVSGGKCNPNVTDKTREKHSKANKGTTHSVGQRVKTSASKRNAFYPVLDLELVRQNLTYRMLAKLMGVKREFISKKLNGIRRLDEKTALTVREVLGVDMPLEELFKTVEGNTASDGE